MLSARGSEVRIIPDATTVNHGYLDSSGSVDGNSEGMSELSLGHNIQCAAAHFLLKMKEERKITQTAVDGIVKDMTDLWDEAMKQVCDVSLS